MAYADRDISADEMRFIHETLGYRLSHDNLMDFICSDSVGPRYDQEIASPLKYFVLSDAGQKEANDPYRYRKYRAKQ